MPLGDSITYGKTDGSLSDALTVGYRQKLYLDLVSLGYDVDFVGGEQSGQSALPVFDYEHEGHRGFRDDEIAAAVYSWLVNNPADIILLHIGTNSLDTSELDVRKILEEIDRYSPEVIVVLARIINQAVYNPDVTKFNDNVEKMALGRIQFGDKIVIVDQENALVYPDDLADNIHPNKSGYSKMADVWLDGLLEVLPLIQDAIGTFRKGTWYFDNNGNDQWDSNYDTSIPKGSFGFPDGIPITGDWNGDGYTKIGQFRRGAWYLDLNGNGIWDPGVNKDRLIPLGSFGYPDGVPITGDWNGDGKTNIGQFRRGVWYLDLNGNGIWDPGDKKDKMLPLGSFGYPDGIPITGDWNGDGFTNIGQFRKGVWYLDLNGDGKWKASDDKFVPLGSFGYMYGTPITGDWNGDGKTNIGQFRNGIWYLDYNGNYVWDRGDIAIPAGAFGQPDDIPIVGRWKKKLF